MTQITELLKRLAVGDDTVMEPLLSHVYDELREIARLHLRNQLPGHTLTPTALVHEAFLKLMGGKPIDWQNRTHFFAVASKAMRFVLVDHARRCLAKKRNAETAFVSFPGDAVRQALTPEDLLEIDLALDKLASAHERQASVVELYVFGGLTHAEISDVLGVSIPTIERDWRYARAWLTRELEPLVD